MSLVGTSVLYAAEIVMRRLLPLSTLLKLTLVFPDHAPARFRVALRTGTPKQLARKLQDAQLGAWATHRRKPPRSCSSSLRH